MFQGKAQFSSTFSLFSSHYCPTCNTSDTRHVGSFPTTRNSLSCQLGILQFNSVLTLSTWRWHQTPQFAQSHKTAPPIFNSKSRFSPVSLTYSAKVTMTLMFISINLLKQFTELWETFYLLDDQFFVRGCNSGTSRWKRRSVQGVGRDMELPHSEPTSLPRSPRVHPPRAFWTLSFWVFRGPSLHSHDRLNHWPLIIKSISNSSLRRWSRVVGLKVSTSVIKWLGFPGNQPHP